MFHRNRPLLLVAASILAVCGPGAAPAQTQFHRPDAEGYPCAARDRLTVVQDEQGFSIMSARVEPSPAPVTRASPVPLGTRLKLDRALFVAAAPDTEEASNDARR